MKKNIRTAIDIGMLILLPMLMAYSLIGETFHEIIGTVMFALFIVHHILNRRWHRALFRVRYTPQRIFQTVLNTVLLIFMIAQPVSGILMSKHVFRFIRIDGVSASAREIHLLLAYWGFVLLCLHAGTHLGAPLRELERKHRQVRIAVLAVLGAVSVYGIVAFVKRQLVQYMFGITSFAFFDYSEPRIHFFLDYIAIMILFVMIGLLIAEKCRAAVKHPEN